MVDRTIADDAKKAYGDGWERPDIGHEFSNHRRFDDTGHHGGIYDIPEPETPIESVITQLQILQGSFGADFDYNYCVSAANDGSVMVWGSRLNDTDEAGLNTLDSAGCAWFATLSGGSWGSIQKVVPSDRAATAFFGGAAEIARTAGNVAVIGAANDSSGFGKAYIFTESGGVWSEAAIIANPVAGADRFGFDVAISDDGTLIAISAPDADVSAVDDGAVYVYSWNGTTATLLATLSISDGEDDDNFGESISMSGDGSKIVVGAIFAGGHNLAFPTAAGAAYVFINPGTWANATENQRLMAPTPAAFDLFGVTSSNPNIHYGRALVLSQSGNRLVVGAPLSDTGGTNLGDVFGFTFSGGSYSQDFVFSGDTADSYFGESLAISANGTYLVVGEESYDPAGSPAYTGRAHLYIIESGTPRLLGEIERTPETASDFFGFHVWIGDGYIFVVASDYDGAGTDRGGVYAYSYT